jgi:hypothetical protein
MKSNLCAMVVTEVTWQDRRSVDNPTATTHVFASAYQRACGVWRAMSSTYTTSQSMHCCGTAVSAAGSGTLAV